MPRRPKPPKKVFVITSSHRRALPYIAHTVEDAIGIFRERVYRATTRGRNAITKGATVTLHYKGRLLIEHIGEPRYKDLIHAAVRAIDGDPLAQYEAAPDYDDNPLYL